MLLLLIHPGFTLFILPKGKESAMTHDEMVIANHQAALPDLHGRLAEHRGEFALIREGKVLGLFATEDEAVARGESDFPDDWFSVQEITDRRVDLGFFSHIAFLRTSGRSADAAAYFDQPTTAVARSCPKPWCSNGVLSRVGCSVRLPGMAS